MGIVNNQVIRMAEVKPKIPQATTTTYQANQSDGEPPDEIKTEKIEVDSTISKESTLAAESCIERQCEEEKKGTCYAEKSKENEPVGLLLPVLQNNKNFLTGSKKGK
nr:unnamed protein product [Callosobruchus chinensis]